jgi:catechol 2,3-dioxygenase
MSDHLVSEALYLTDPDGLGIEVYADRPRTDWRYAGRELQMATIPLHVEDLMAAGGTERWTGMPNGTSIGHVHLHVGDLEKAAAFYHEALGFDKVVWSYPGALFLSAGGYHHHLGTNTWAAGAQPATDEDARLVEWELVMPDAPSVSAAGASVEASGGSVERSADGSILARDPWGTAVRLVSR